MSVRGQRPTGTTAARPALVELQAIRKSFGDLVVNDGVDLSLRPGEVHALLGENGAGKTTLMRILYGLTRPDGGRILVDGEATTITSPRDAIRHGIGMVTQHFSLVKPMTVTENVMLSGVGLGPLDLTAGKARVLAAAERLGVTIDPDARVARLSVGEQQRIEILKALYHDCRVLILDEPTAVLVPQDVEALFGTVRRLTAQGLGVLFISHKLHEVTSISDRVSVLRRGRIVDTLDAAGVDARHLAELMVGRPTMGVRREDVESPPPESGPVLEVENLGVAGEGRNAVGGVSLSGGAG
jgi:simple sugar transport system ATP-binding protein